MKLCSTIQEASILTQKKKFSVNVFVTDNLNLPTFRRREERLRKVLQARERVEQLEEEKKKKIEQKFAHIDEKSEKVNFFFL